MNEMGGITSTVRFLQEENQRLHERNQELEEESAYLRECLKAIRGLQRAVSGLDTRADVQPFLERIVYEALRAVDAADGSLILIDEEAQELVFVVVRGALQQVLQGYHVPLETGIVGWVVAHREPVIANETGQDARFSPVVDTEFQFSTQSLIALPLISRGKVLGAIEVLNKFNRHPFDERDLDILSTLAPIAATAIDLLNLAGE